MIFTFGTDLTFSTPLRNNLRGKNVNHQRLSIEKKIDVFLLLLKCKTCALIKYKSVIKKKCEIMFQKLVTLNSLMITLTIISIWSLFCLSFISSLLLISVFKNTEKVMFEFSFSSGFAK